jgi:hypothetical protein
MSPGNRNRILFSPPFILSKKIAPVAGILILSLLIVTVSAHPPSDMTLQYQSGELIATITHGVANPATHYVYRVTILVNGNPTETVLYSSQPSDTRFTYRYPVSTSPGDTIEVTAECNIAGSITRDLVTGGSPGQESPVPVLWPYHALLQTLGFVLLVSAILMVQFGKKIPGWYRWHKRLAHTGTVLTIIALGIGVAMVQLSGGPHIRVSHAGIGVLTVVLLILTILLGYAKEKVRPPRLYLKTVHIISGLVTLLFLVFTIILGLGTTGLI